VLGEASNETGVSGALQYRAVDDGVLPGLLEFRAAGGFGHFRGETSSRLKNAEP
jgi:hypothetical protein